MQSWLFVELTDPKAVVAGKNGELWLPLSESDALSSKTETVTISNVFFDVIGYSVEREALLLSPIVIDGAADNIELELASHIAEQ